MKLLASDYDGTLRRNGVIREKDLIAIRRFREAGNLFGVVTGRCYDMIRNEFTHYGLELDFLICNNGSTIFDLDGNCLMQINFENDLAQHVLHYLEKEPDLLFGACDGKRYFNETKGNFGNPLFPHPIGHVLSTKEDVLKKNEITAFFYRGSDYHATLRIGNEIKEKFGDALGYHPNGSAMDLSPVGINKANTLHILAKTHKDVEITTIGDHMNDIDMVREFNGFAIAEGRDELKLVAKEVVEDIADAIERLMN
ncbi:MAG: HAD hydrolase family protein [Erysipelotrichaceae bacterium]